MPLKYAIFILLSSGVSCKNNFPQPEEKLIASEQYSLPQSINRYGTINAIPIPAGFERIEQDKDSFGNWLRSIALKKDKAVYKYDGTLKANQSAQFAVLDISVGKKDLQQCADAIMRLRAEYLFDRERFDEILFTDNAGTAYQFTPPYNRENLLYYLEKVFGMCGSASLSKQLKTKEDLSSIIPGDVLIRGGFPGHAVIVVDVAENAAGKKMYLLAQSYMPAQDIHILVNPLNDKLSPWYEVNEDILIKSPEYSFKRTELKHW